MLNLWLFHVIGITMVIISLCCNSPCYHYDATPTVIQFFLVLVLGYSSLLWSKERSNYGYVVILAQLILLVILNPIWPFDYEQVQVALFLCIPTLLAAIKYRHIFVSPLSAILPATTGPERCGEGQIENTSYNFGGNHVTLISCPECQHEISDKAPTCPNCGLPLTGTLPGWQDEGTIDPVKTATPIQKANQYARRTLSIVLLLVRATAFAGALCGVGMLILYVLLTRYAETMGCPIVIVLDGTLRTPETKQIQGITGLVLVLTCLVYIVCILVKHHKASLGNHAKHILLATLLAGISFAFGSWFVQETGRRLTCDVMTHLPRERLDAMYGVRALGASNWLVQTQTIASNTTSRMTSARGAASRAWMSIPVRYDIEPGQPFIFPLHSEGATWKTFDDDAQSLYEKKEYSRGLEQARKAVEIAETTHGVDDSSVAKTLNTLAELFRAQNKLTEAETYLRRALAIYEKSRAPPPSAHPTFADRFHELFQYSVDDIMARRTILHNLVSLYVGQEKYAQAEQVIQNSLTIKDLHDDYNVQRELAELYRIEGKLTEAEPLYHRLVAAATDGETRILCRDLDGLIYIYATQGKYSLAEPICQRALRIAEEKFGPHQVEVADHLRALGNLHTLQNQHNLADPLFKRALSIYEKTLGAKHYTVSEILLEMADSCRQNGQAKEATALEKRARKIQGDY